MTKVTVWWDVYQQILAGMINGKIERALVERIEGISMPERFSDAVVSVTDLFVEKACARLEEIQKGDS